MECSGVVRCGVVQLCVGGGGVAQCDGGVHGSGWCGGRGAGIVMF